VSRVTLAVIRALLLPLPAILAAVSGALPLGL
jgi:hypothetical protein